AARPGAAAARERRRARHAGRRTAGHQGQRHRDRPCRGGRQRRQPCAARAGHRGTGPGQPGLMKPWKALGLRLPALPSAAWKAALAAGLALASHPLLAATVKITGGAGGPAAAGDFTLKTQVLVVMTLLGLLPVLVLIMTSFTRFVIVLSLLRQA